MAQLFSLCGECFEVYRNSNAVELSWRLKCECELRALSVILSASDLLKFDLVGIVRWNIFDESYESSGLLVSWNESTIA